MNTLKCRFPCIAEVTLVLTGASYDQKKIINPAIAKYLDFVFSWDVCLCPVSNLQLTISPSIADCLS